MALTTLFRPQSMKEFRKEIEIIVGRLERLYKQLNEVSKGIVRNMCKDKHFPSDKLKKLVR